MQRHWHWLGALIGLALGMLETGLLAAAGVSMTFRGRDVALPVAAVFEVSYAAIGYLMGRLLQTRAALATDATTIRAQLVEIERSRAVALHHERMAGIGRLAAGIAHEVRNPLGVIRSSTSMIAGAVTHDSDATRACQFILDETDRLDGFIATLLAFAKPTTLRRRACTLSDVVTRAVDLSAQAARRTGATLTPPATTEASFLADRDLVTQVILGLLVNALEAVGPGGTVSIATAADETSVTVRVIDDGPGVADVARLQLFEPFFTTKPDGTGLGLSVAAEVVAAHGGTLDYEDQRGLGPDRRGACFVLSLPRVDPAQALA